MKITRALDSVYRKWLEIRRPSKGEYSGVDTDGYYFVRDLQTGSRIFVSHQRRLAYYRDGVEARVSNLAREYCVDTLTLSSNDQVVDVGAHSGEFGLWVRRFGGRYLGIEPDPTAFGALERNFPTAALEQVAVGAERGVAEFSLATSTGDSSFGSSGGTVIQVAVERLDDVVNRNFPSRRIAVLKVEAEGFEPEVLRGASQTLQRTDVVTVDAGEEREGKSTAPECVNILLNAGFELRQVFLRRGVFRFESVEKA